MSIILTPFEESDLSGLSTTDPGGYKPWKYAGATGWQIVFGAFTQQAGITDHGALTGLGDDDHPQYLLANGARYMNGNLRIDVAAGIYTDIGKITGLTDRTGFTFQANGNTATMFLFQGGSFVFDVPGGLFIRTSGAVPLFTVDAMGNANPTGDCIVGDTKRIADGGGWWVLGYAYAGLKLTRGHGLHWAPYGPNGTFVQVTDTSITSPSPGTVRVSGNFEANALTKKGTYTVATLPSASANAGYEAEVTDSSVTTFRNVVAGGGLNRVNVKSNGTNWLVN